MIKFFTRVCDFCREDTTYFDGTLHIRRRWSTWDGSGGWTKLDICPDCAKKLTVEIDKELKKETKEIERSIL